MAAAEKTLSQRELNRATLARQHLLERTDMSSLDMVEHLAGMQAQVPHGPYAGLFARIDGFDPAEASGLLSERKLIRGWFMRGTIHLISSRDSLRWWPLTERVLVRTFKGTTFSKELGSAPIDEVLQAARQMVEVEPLLRSEIGRRLGERWPDAVASSLGFAAGYRLPLVQVTPRGLWGQTGQARLTTIEAWLGDDLATDPPIEDLVLRYLGALGPATVKDFQNWSGLTRIAEVVDRLRPQLATFRAEDGRELFDLPDAPRPGADVPSPPRFLPEYDNLLLGHADRSRLADKDAKGATLFTASGPFQGTLLVDGLLSGSWRLHREASAVELHVRHFKPLPRPVRSEVEAEGRLLVGLIAAGADDCRVRFSRI